MLTTLLTSGLMLTYSGGVAHVRIVDHLGPFDTKLDYLGPARTAKTAKGTVQVIPLKLGIRATSEYNESRTQYIELRGPAAVPYKIKFELAHPYVKNLQIDGRDVDVWEHASPKVMVGSKASWTIGLSGGQHEIRIVTGDYE